MVIFHSYVSLPEGIHRYSTVPLGYSIMIPIWILVLGDPIFVWYQTGVYVRIPLYPRISPTVSPWWLVLHLTFSLVKYRYPHVFPIKDSFYIHLWMISPYFHMCHGCHGQKSFWSIAQKWGDDDQSMKFGMYMPNICIYIYTCLSMKRDEWP